MEKRDVYGPRVVIIGAGFGGLRLAMELRSAPFEVILVDRNNYHTFQPLLYQVATAGLEPDEIAYAVRGVYQDYPHIQFRLGEVCGLDKQKRHIVLKTGETIWYDYLVLAAGASTNDFGIEGVAQHGYFLKTLQQAVYLRAHIMGQFERVAVNPSLRNKGALNFAIVGGGPTGVELAGAIYELIHMVLTKDFAPLDLSDAKVYLIEATDQLLGGFAPELGENAIKVLEKRGIEVLRSKMVTKVTADQIQFKDGETLSAQTLVWAAGIKANPLAEATGFATGRGGRIVVNPDLTVPDHPDIFVIGDMAGSTDEHGVLHPQLAPTAVQGAQYVARTIWRRHDHLDPLPPFAYKDKGIMATIGRNAAVVQLPSGYTQTGWLAWLIWLFLHLVLLIGFRNRLNVLINWAWNYLTYDRSARLIFDVNPDGEMEHRAGR